MIWKEAYLHGERVHVRPHRVPAYLMIHSTVPALWEVRYSCGRVVLVEEGVIDFIS